MGLFGRKTAIVAPDQALPGRAQPIEAPPPHAVSGRPLVPPYPEGFALATVAMGCFWGAERLFWQAPGVWVTAVGYAGGTTPNPTYEEVCSGLTGHAEAVRVVFDPGATSYEAILKLFWEEHDPTQGMRQGNDVGSQYRSAILTEGEEQARIALATREAYQRRLSAAGFGAITTEIAPAGPFYFAEGHHQQYLHTRPWGYCGLEGSGIACPVGLGAAAE
jgi:peptide-methionine (S)-S-oxide reductase